MWILYEKRIDKYLQEKHFDMTCIHTRPQVRDSILYFKYQIIVIDSYSTRRNS